MKKFYSVLMMVIITIIGSAAMRADDVDSLTFTFNIDNPDAVAVEIGSNTQQIVAGDNTFTVAPYTSVMVRAVAPTPLRASQMPRVRLSLAMCTMAHGITPPQNILWAQSISPHTIWKKAAPALSR